MKIEDKIELVKWFLGSFVIVIITTIISYQFQDREHGINEMNQYDKYVTELIVLNKDLGKRRLLAQYFAYVTPSDKLKEPWMDYYLLIDKEYKQLQIQDSLITIQLSRSSDTIIEFGNHENLLEKQEEIRKNLNDDLIMPNGNNKSDEAAKFERLGFDSAINGDTKSAINYFEKCESVYPGYHSSYEIIKYLKENINSDKNPICEGLLKYTWKVPKDITDRLK
jgi:hypothetical protein